MDAHPAFNRWLKRLRADLDLTQERLAEQVGCSIETIRAFEAGRRRPSRAMSERLAEVLAVDPARPMGIRCHSDGDGLAAGRPDYFAHPPINTRREGWMLTLYELR